MQQHPQMMPMMQTSFPPSNLTTEQIQKYLDENKKLIMAILDNQNLGKLAECAQYQAQLQKNLMYLAAIADAQPPAPTVPPQMAPHPSMQQGAYFMQNPQAAAAMAQQSSTFPQKVPLQFNQMQDPEQQLRQQVFQGQMGMRPGGANRPIHAEAGGSGPGPLSNAGPGPNNGRGGNKQDAGASGGDGQGSEEGK